MRVRCKLPQVTDMLADAAREDDRVHAVEAAGERCDVLARGSRHEQGLGKQQQIRALGRLGWTLSRIQDATGIRRETISTVVQT